MDYFLMKWTLIITLSLIKGIFPPFSDTSKTNYMLDVMIIANDKYSFELVSEEFAIKELQGLKQN